MKKIFTFMLLAILAFTAGAQKVVNDPNAEKREVKGFHAIEVGGGIDLYLSQGNEAVAVSASEAKFRERIKTEVVNGVLKMNLGQDIPFLLNQTPSVVVNSDAGNGIGYTGIRIRGTDATRINVTLNGIPYNDAESQGTFFRGPA